jgi:O-glycosyl hydrolase
MEVMEMMFSGYAKPLACTCILACVTSYPCFGQDAAKAVTVTVDRNVTYQTIDGFGAHGAMNVWWSNGPFFNQQFLDSVIDDLGLTIIRNEYYPTVEEPNQWPKQVPYLRAMKAKAESSGEPLKFIATFWTPPGRMKDNNSTKKGGHVLPEFYDDLGEYTVKAIQDYKDAGIDLYAISLQNEPNFVEPYNSCVYTRGEYSSMLKVAGPIIKEAFPNVNIFGAEHMLWALEWPKISYEGGIIEDKEALKYIDIWACHGYGNDGKTPEPDSKEAHQWAAGHKNLANTNKPLWMTETSGYQENWKDAIQLGQSIYAALKYGKISAWVWWQISERGLGRYVLMDLGKPGKRYYVSKNYYRYIRPGAVMIEVNADDDGILVTAFVHEQKETMTLVVINTDQDSRDVKLSGSGLPEKFTLYRTSESENCADVGAGLSTDSISLPGRTVTTLYGSL